MKTQLVLLAAGLLGSALKAWSSNSQGTMSKKSVIDIIIGGVAAILIPTFAPTLLPATADLMTQAAVIVMISYASTSFIQNILTKLGVAADPGIIPPQR